jgi:hypothetical protein
MYPCTNYNKAFIEARIWVLLSDGEKVDTIADKSFRKEGTFGNFLVGADRLKVLVEITVCIRVAICEVNLILSVFEFICP